MTRNLIGLIAATALFTGCAWGDGEKSSQKVAPADFTAAAVTTSGRSQTASASPSNDNHATGTPATSGSPSSSPSDAIATGSPAANPNAGATVVAVPVKPGEGLMVAGMVGQVNGQPIYARTILEPLDEQLTRLGQSLPTARFRQEIRKPIAGILQETVFNAMILGEAERDLSENEQKGLKFALTERREELIRRWGGGAPLVADQALLEKTGKGLDASVQEIRVQLVVQRYMAAKLHPKINVTRKDIERYYLDNAETYKPSAWRTVRLIRAADQSSLDQVQQMLSGGQAFTDVAALPVNSFNQAQGGLLGERMTGDNLLVVKPLNAEMLKLKAGETSPMIMHEGSAYWVHVQELETGRERPLREVQKEIEDILRRQQFQRLTAAYRDDLFRTGAFDSLKDMTDAVVEIAVAKYAAAE